MRELIISIDYPDPLWILIAFVFGFAVRLVNLPPLIGFLGAGFVLNSLGAKGGAFLNELADLGVTLLLFTIGLKLQVRGLLRPEIWGVACLHMVLMTALGAGFVLLLGLSAAPLMPPVDLKQAGLIGFALCFSSTVFAVKVLQEQGAMNSRYGRLAVGILIVQDIAAVIFLGVSAGKAPSPWALALVLLIPAGSLFKLILDRVGHGELLILFGIVVALGGASLFEQVGMEGDLGALVFGALLSGSAKTTELAKSLLGFKELFLVGFFLSIGLSALPGWTDFGSAILLLPLLAIKILLFIGLLCGFRVRARSSTLAALSLASYSEFGLIVGAVAVSSGWLDPAWLVAIAITLVLSYVLAVPLNDRAEDIYDRFHDALNRLEHGQRLLGDEVIRMSGVRAAVLGMGRVGTGAYDALRAEFGDALIGVDINHELVARQCTVGRKIIVGDVLDHEFWRRAESLHGELEIALLTMPVHRENLTAVRLLREQGYVGRIGVIARFPDEVDELKALGVEAAFNLYAEAGAGFASHLLGKR
ncbi:MAG: cation:proton antiporter [Methylococcales bacterium]